MKNTTFVSAGAGSGKTYKITQDIAKMIADGECKAEEIILTTFTDSAAKELREKVRSALYSKGLYDAAMNIDNAAIGTIHSIAYQLVSRYWYLLGISANVSIMDTEGSKFCISQSLASLPGEEDLMLFDTIFKTFNPTKLVNNVAIENPDFWKEELKNIIDKTVELCIDESQLEKAREESKKLLSEVIKWNGFNITKDIIKNVCNCLKPIFDVIADKAKKDKDEKKKELYNSLTDLENYDGTISNLPLCKLHALIIKYVKAPQKYLVEKFPDDISNLKELMDKIPASNQVKNLVESYIDSIFRLAIKWKTEYEEFKRKRCLLDFSDLLQKFDELLQKEEVVTDIKSRYKVAFVDEFQDCSPLQVKTFVRLSELMTQSVWVGDIKQAIYGFRGTNIELINSIIKEVEQKKNGNKLDRLECCWRSNETIVNFVNNIFCNKVFNGQLKDEFIRLSMPNRTENDPPAPEERELQHIHIVSCTKDLKPNSQKIDNPEALAEKVEELIKNGIFKANEIAILYRTNTDIKKCTKALKEKNITYNVRVDSDYGRNDENNDLISSFINALISFVAQSGNELSKAIIVNRIESGYSISALLTDKLRNDKNWLADVDIISRIADIRKTVGNQSVSAAIETIVVELNLVDLIKRIEPTAPTYNYCSALESKVATYESLCANLGLSSTLVGFAEYLKSHPIEFPGDDNGVSIVTYHKSKGLEWPCVILCSLHKVPVDAKKTFFGVLTCSTIDNTLLRLIPESIQGICSDIMDRFEENDFFENIKQTTINEAKRLMYVGMTRPKEQLILTTYGTKDGDDWLKAIGCDSLGSHAEEPVIEWGNSKWNHSVIKYIVSDNTDKIFCKTADFKVLKQFKELSSFAPKFVSPSKVKEDKLLYSVTQCDSFAKRISATAKDGQDSTIGNFIHHVMCLWNGDKSIIKRLAETYNVNVDIDAVTTSIVNFWSWMEKKYGKALKIEREVPFTFTNELGQVVNGEIDLVYQTEDGDILIDYKTYQGKDKDLTDENSNYFAGKYGSQIAFYEEALTRNDRTVRDRLICYMSLGVIVKFDKN